MKRSSIVLIAIAITTLGVVLPVSWQVMQTELAQSRNMKALDKTIKQIDEQSKSCEPAKLRQLASAFVESSLQIDAAFGYLVQGSEEFAHLSAAMQAQAKQFETATERAGCEARSQLAELKGRCKACHGKFR